MLLEDETALAVHLVAMCRPSQSQIRITLPRSYFKSDAAWEANKRAIEDAVERGEIVIEDLGIR
ncbi:MAG: hypothetical protein H7Y17_05695 [Chlorobia bacterium]|nr:hypothetical protein [Fimbriimonadaceae bacterium]